jgi:hypothetical protein
MNDENKSAKDVAEHSTKRKKISTSEEMELSSNSINDLEEKRGGKLISFKEFQDKSPIWIAAYVLSFARYGNVDSVIHIFEYAKNESQFKFTYNYSLFFYTETTEYCITITTDHLLLTCESRKCLPGEINPRGKKLFGGKSTMDSMEVIMSEIIKNELKSLNITVKKSK